VVEGVPTLDFECDEWMVFGMGEGRRHSGSAIVRSHYVLALAEKQSHVS
jgi:hypothetical protein